MNENQLHTKQIFTAKAHATFDIRGLLIPWFSYRCYFRLKPSEKHGTNYHHTKTIYGDEHSCTYKQCLAGYYTEIVLDRLKGYEALIKLIEKKWRGKHTVATIFGIDQSTGRYDIRHRTYLDGRLQRESVNDPTIEVDQQFRTLYFTVQRGQLHISELPASPEFIKNIKAESSK